MSLTLNSPIYLHSPFPPMHRMPAPPAGSLRVRTCQAWDMPTPPSRCTLSRPLAYSMPLVTDPCSPASRPLPFSRSHACYHPTSQLTSSSSRASPHSRAMEDAQSRKTRPNDQPSDMAGGCSLDHVGGLPPWPGGSSRDPHSPHCLTSQADLSAARHGHWLRVLPRPRPRVTLHMSMPQCARSIRP